VKPFPIVAIAVLTTTAWAQPQLTELGTRSGTWMVSPTNSVAIISNVTQTYTFLVTNSLDRIDASVRVNNGKADYLHPIPGMSSMIVQAGLLNLTQLGSLGTAEGSWRVINLGVPQTLTWSVWPGVPGRVPLVELSEVREYLLGVTGIDPKRDCPNGSVRVYLDGLELKHKGVAQDVPLKNTMLVRARRIEVAASPDVSCPGMRIGGFLTTTYPVTLSSATARRKRD
jgi:hypothetical protein